MELPYWIREFLSYTEGIPSPYIYRKWAAITALSGALERRAYLWTTKRLLFPNLFVLLVGPPGVGKSAAIEEVQDLWGKAGRFNVAPGSMTGKGVVDQLNPSQVKSLSWTKTETGFTITRSLYLQRSSEP